MTSKSLLNLITGFSLLILTYFSPVLLPQVMAVTCEDYPTASPLATTWKLFSSASSSNGFDCKSVKSQCTVQDADRARTDGTRTGYGSIDCATNNGDVTNPGDYWCYYFDSNPTGTAPGRCLKLNWNSSSPAPTQIPISTLVPTKTTTTTPPTVTPALAQSAQRWVCLDALWCYDNGNCPQKDGHTARLATSNVKPLPSTTTYVFECLPSDSGEICTSGNSAIDTKIYGVDNTSTLRKLLGYEFHSFTKDDGSTVSNPLTSLASGDLGSPLWKSTTTNVSGHKFMAMNYYTPSNSNNGTAGGNQQGDMSFDTVNKNCSSINWDPYGRVFDATTLEPVPHINVGLYQMYNGVLTMVGPDTKFVGAIQNPYQTKEDGAYSFVVPDGTYQLQAQIADGKYIFPVSAIPTMNSKYNMVYRDIYPAATGINIVQKSGIPQHRDIPLKQNGASGVYELKKMEYSYELDKTTGNAVVQGRISHPLAVVTAFGVDTKTGAKGTYVTSINANTDGVFKIEIAQNQLAKGEVFGVLEMGKPGIMQKLSMQKTLQGIWNVIADSVVKSIFAADTRTVIMRFEPILNYIEGYAYDAAGKVLPNTKVGIYLVNTTKPYYETMTDIKGFYKIESRYLPTLPYKLKYTVPGKTAIEVSTQKFIAQNTSTSTGAANIDFYTYRKASNSASLTSGSKNDIAFNQSQIGGSANGDNKVATSGKPKTTVTGGNSNGSLIMTALVIIGLLLATGVGLGLYLLKKKKDTEIQTPTL
ncbi:hypothetical protein HGB07_03145 [Candidatus Roizmanbacteria bacterium]|nr:hypothetical protein [Candidatus Roizmanbacteria bacterium]